MNKDASYYCLLIALFLAVFDTLFTFKNRTLEIISCSITLIFMALSLVL